MVMVELFAFQMSETGITSLNGQRVAFDANGDFVSTNFILWNYNNQPTGEFQYKQVKLLKP